MDIIRGLLARPGMDRSRLAVFLGVAGAVFVVDQVSKAVVRRSLEIGETWPAGWEVIRLTHVQNSGAAFGMLQGQAPYLAFVSIFMMLALVAFLATLPSHTRWYPLALSGILGGAVGNFVDRIRMGHVTDFIDPMRYPSFNLADSAIVVGVALVVILTLFGHEDPSARPTAEASTDEQPRDERASEART